jgi:hypothetical protein
MSTNKEELFDRYQQQVKRLYSAVIEGSKEALAFIPAIEQGSSGIKEIQEQFQVSSDLQQLKLEKDEARRAFDESVPHEGQIAQDAEALRELEPVLDAAVEEIATRPPINVGIGGVFAFERDPSGEKIDQFSEALFGVDFTKQRVVTRGDEDPIGSARHIGHRIAFKLFSRDVFDRIETFCGKGKAYFAETLRKEQSRNIRDEEIEDRNFLGVTPKESRHLSKDDREQIRALNQTAAEAEDLATAAAISDSENAEEIALSREEESSMELFLDRKGSELPDDLRLLFEAARAGESMTVARRRLGLPRSTETALRNRFKRWAREWRDEQASLEFPQKNLPLA